MKRAGLNPEDLEVDEDGTRARLPGIRSPEPHIIHQENLDFIGQWPGEDHGAEISGEAAAIFAVYLADA